MRVSRGGTFLSRRCDVMTHARLYLAWLGSARLGRSRLTRPHGALHHTLFYFVEIFMETHNLGDGIFVSGLRLVIYGVLFCFGY